MTFRSLSGRPRRGGRPHPDEAIDYFSKRHPLRGVATRVAYRARTKMFARYASMMPVDPSLTVLDVGVTPDRDLKDSNFFEQLYPHPERITATSIEDASFLEEQYPGLTFVRTEGVELPFEDGQFDVVFCSAVLEHVGDRDAQRRFLAEVCRVGRALYLTTPDRSFPVELHTFLPFFHWLPQRLHHKVLRALGMHFWARTENLNLCRAPDIRGLLPSGIDARILRHRTLGLSSNLIVVRTAG